MPTSNDMISERKPTKTNQPNKQKCKFLPGMLSQMNRHIIYTDPHDKVSTGVKNVHFWRELCLKKTLGSKKMLHILPCHNVSVTPITGRSCHKYLFYRDNSSVMTNMLVIHVRHDKHLVCQDETHLLSRQRYACCDKTCVATKVVVTSIFFVVTTNMRLS